MVSRQGVLFGRSALLRALFIGYRVMEGQPGRDTLQKIRTIPSRTDQFPNPDHMHSSLLLGIRIFDQGDLGAGLEALDLRQLDIVIDSLTLEFEVEACVLEGPRKLHNRLTKILNLLLARHLYCCDC